MPPNVPRKKKPSGVPDAAIQRVKPMDAVLGFVTSGGVEDAIRARNFSLKEEAEIVIDHIRHEDPGISLKALNYWRGRLLPDVIEHSGLKGRATAVERRVGEDGTETTRTVHTTILNRLSQEPTDADPNRYERHESHAPGGAAPSPDRPLPPGEPGE